MAQHSISIPGVHSPPANLWRVALLRAPFAELTYAAPCGLGDALAPGLRVLVPLGRSCACGVLTAPQDKAPAGVAVKELIWPLEREPLLTPTSLELARTLADRHLAPLGQALHFLLPPPLRRTKVRFSAKAADLPRTLSAADVAKLPSAERSRLALLWAQGRMEIRAAPPSPDEETLTTACDPPWPLRPGATRLASVLDHLHDAGPQTRAALARALGPQAAQAIRTLKDRALIRTVPEDEGQGDEGLDDTPACGEDLCQAEGSAGGCAVLKPTDDQQAAVDQLRTKLDQALETDSVRSALLYGVTGSGKTLVYLELAKACLQAGRPVLLLAPEIALACSLAQAARDYPAAALPEAEVLLTHGAQPPAAREKAFRRAATGGKLVLVGTRSALLTPLPRPGLIILDEEHDESYKQDERLPYQAKEVAWFLAARAGGALLVLGSATPDIKTLRAADEGAMARVDLTRRVGSRPLPDVELVDISAPSTDLDAVPDPHNHSLAEGEPLAQPTLDAIQKTLQSGQQAVVMLNRRGYAPLMYCTDCGQTARCPECDVGYTFHKGRSRLSCHYCGGSQPFPAPCAECGATSFVPMGQGTERVAERVAEHLESLAPGAKVLRLDRDTARRPEAAEATLAAFAARDAQVLVGTQMLSKGHNFPGVTLVAVADGDLGLNLPEYRASERAFQLITQVAGRAGRGDAPGKILIQTRNPSHPFWTLVMARDYEPFARRELDLRQRYNYPPFVKLGLIRISHPITWKPGPATLVQVGEAIQQAAGPAGVLAMGPTPAPLALLRGRRRFHCLLKAPDYGAVRAVYAAAKALAKPGGELRVSLDYDPLSLL